MFHQSIFWARTDNSSHHHIRVAGLRIRSDIDLIRIQPLRTNQIRIQPLRTNRIRIRIQIPIFVVFCATPGAETGPGSGSKEI